MEGVSFVGPIPDDVQRVTTFSAGIAAASKSRATARQLIEHLASAQARETIRQTGLDPVKTPHQIAFTRVFPNAGQIGLFIAAADGSGERPLFDTPGFDYDATWSPDGATIVYTSDREGSPDLFRIKPDGTGRERLTDDPAYDDQAAFSPDGTQLAFVSTRNGGYARIWTMDLRSRQVKAVTTTTAATGIGGDFRPSWSPDGRWIAFSSDRGTTMKMARGRWEALQPADIYVVRPDGTGLRRVNTPGNFCGSPKFSSDGARLLAYCMPLESTLETRRPNPLPGNDTTLVSIDIATGKVDRHSSRPRREDQPGVSSRQRHRLRAQGFERRRHLLHQRQARAARQRARRRVVAGRQPRRLSSPPGRAADIVAERRSPAIRITSSRSRPCCRRSIHRAISS